MSLLLQALQKAANTRDGGPPGDEPHAAIGSQEGFDLNIDAGRHEPAADDLTLADDDMFEPEQTLGPEPGLAPAVTSPTPLAASAPARSSLREPAATSAQAATILRASETQGAGWFDWVRDRPVHAFAILAAIFLVFYGGYVYLQIFHPGLLQGNFLPQRPLRATTPPPAPSPISQTPAAVQEPSASVAAAPAPAPLVATGGAAATPEPAAIPPQTRNAEPDPDETADPADVARAQAKSRRASPSRPAATRSPRRQEAPEADAMEDTVAVRQSDSSAAVNAATMQAWEALQRGQLAEAEELYRRVRESEPQSVDALLGLASIAAQHGNSDQAARHFSEALDLEPRNPTAQAGLISVLGQADPQFSESRLKQLISQEPSSNLYFALGNLYAAQDRWAQAQQVYFQAYQLAPDNPDYAYNLAVGLEHLSQPKIALDYYRRAVELSNLKGHASFDASRVQDRIGQLAARVGNE
jgi:tetratricopeptide (TPR) repeat protein